MTGEPSYQLLARHYDAIHESKPYETEAQHVLNLIEERFKGQAESLLDVACGTGRHLAEFTRRFECVGVDANRGMLKLARQRAPEATLIQADMCSLSLDREFDALTCLFGSIGYLETWPRLEQAVETFANHLRPGGVFVIESWIRPGVLEQPRRRVRSYEDEERAIARVAVAHPPEEGRSHLDIHWLICEDGATVQHRVEQQTLGVFGVEETEGLLAKHGLEATVLDGLTDWRVLFVGQRR